MSPQPTLRIPALAFNQARSTPLFAFVIEGRRLPEFASITRIRRDGLGTLRGYQRPEVQRHIAEIRAYLESGSARLPNALVLAFDERVHFEPRRGRPLGNLGAGEAGRFGTLVIPANPDTPDHEKPAWVVDGQQRMTALQDADPELLRAPFPVCVVAFVAEDEAEQREQFILVNATKPLPKSLLYELLPVTEGPLPSALAARRFPASLLTRMNLNPESPFHRRIKTPTNPDGDIKDNSVLRMLEHSLSDGALYRYRGDNERSDDPDMMLRVLRAYWAAVARVFPEAWSRPPTRSRLTHGAGIVAMGYLMDAIASQLRRPSRWTAKRFMEELERIRPHCQWTRGTWEFGPGQQRQWNEIQNVSADIHLLTYHLLRLYLGDSGSAREREGESSA